ncbi:DJ-1/PfpI family protein [Listeria sp. PSOL-1]|uniref:DJ-1/PfpI family protein n=1 Tax=Listeria sp. PSOL-1 TaxID=1844999 RepID=UPI0013D570D5|nr:DJ-1/PfpI family protein [Listeria sp. PSOL-1]
MQINILLFPNFEPLDVFGPAEVFHRTPGIQVNYFSITEREITTFDSLIVQPLDVTKINPNETLLIPGGIGTRKLVHDQKFIADLKELVHKAKYCLTVCTGSALLAQTGYLNSRKATSNKLAFEWVSSLNQQVHWVEKARWVVDANIYSSSGVSAGIDMALGFVADKININEAEKVAKQIEYRWNQDATEDEFVLSKSNQKVK